MFCSDSKSGYKKFYDCFLASELHLKLAHMLLHKRLKNLSSAHISEIKIGTTLLNGTELPWLWH
jgi:hypothetical protein